MLVLMTFSNMLAAIKWCPQTLAVHRLSTATGNALLLIMLVRTSVTIVQSNLADTIHTATLIANFLIIVLTRTIDSPSTNTVHRLGTLLNGALLKLISIWASISVVSRCD